MPQPFPNSTARRTANRLAKSNSPAARAMREIANLSQQRSPSATQLRQYVGDLLRMAQRKGHPQLTRKLQHVLSSLTGNVSESVARRAVQTVTGLAGPAGRALSQVLASRRKTGKIKEQLGAAERLVLALEGQTSPNKSGGRRISKRPEMSPPKTSGAPMPPNTFLEPNGQFVRIQSGTFRRRYRLNDPVLTGRMMEVKSSNVHSIGFKFNYRQPERGTLYVRFLGNDRSGNRSGNGPLYEYFDLHPDRFQRFLHAGSKGEWVWDELRVRGSRVQHQVRYSLKGIVNNYMPRRATLRNGREMFVKRTRSTRAAFGQQSQTLTSPLPNQDLGPMRGRPNRGRPAKTGRPSRGR